MSKVKLFELLEVSVHTEKITLENTYPLLLSAKRFYCLNKPLYSISFNSHNPPLI